ncbi:unnamed protein product [Eruca vesicaria subsp. sativa]|uniref:Uncharacterized protein n=1 Tax=Eruca vesicaria subsp. sativa TaxID=29727 RepID=A0ABC8M618_ERUVS|nr:unnamed protein product [Eruca vesicaria subsp. sativa]
MVLKPCSETERDSSNLEEASMEASSVILKPCEGVTAREGCSTELEGEAMEVSLIVEDSRQRKRKAELDPENVEEEEEESDGKIEEDRIEEGEDADEDKC